jgi:hypothetical protein
MAIPCTLIPGDGIGPDITDATLAILEAAGANFDWDRQVAGAAGVAAKGTPMPDETLESIRRTKLALKGPLETPIGEGYRSVNVALRQTFDLYANVRPGRDIVARRPLRRRRYRADSREHGRPVFRGSNTTSASVTIHRPPRNRSRWSRAWVRSALCATRSITRCGTAARK